LILFDVGNNYIATKVEVLDHFPDDVKSRLYLYNVPYEEEHP